MESQLTLPANASNSSFFVLDADYYESINDTFSSGDVCDTFFPPYVDFTQMGSVRHTYIVVYTAIILLSLLGNLLVIWTVWRNKNMRTVTNYYIVNLAVSDFLVALVVMPLKLLEYTAPCRWHVFNTDALCSFLYYILPVFVFVSVLTLVAISIERYYAIVHPLDAMTVHSKSRTKKILATTWVIPVLVASPNLLSKSYAFQLESHYGVISRQICTDSFSVVDIAIYGDENRAKVGTFRMGYHLFLFAVIYLLPLLIIVTTCIRIAICLLKPISDEANETQHGRKLIRKREENKRKVAKMIILVAIAFFVAWTPHYMVSIITNFQEVSFIKDSNFIFTMLTTHLFGFFNSCVNPFIYTIMSVKFRKSFRNIIVSILCCFSKRCAEKSGLQKPFHALQTGQSDYNHSGFERTHSTHVRTMSMTCGQSLLSRLSKSSLPGTPEVKHNTTVTMTRRDSPASNGSAGSVNSTPKKKVSINGIFNRKKEPECFELRRASSLEHNTMKKVAGHNRKPQDTAWLEKIAYREAQLARLASIDDLEENLSESLLADSARTRHNNNKKKSSSMDVLCS